MAKDEADVFDYIYNGEMVVRPNERGTVLVGHPDQEGIETWLPEGRYHVSFMAVRTDKNNPSHIWYCHVCDGRMEYSHIQGAHETWKCRECGHGHSISRKSQ